MPPNDATARRRTLLFRDVRTPADPRRPLPPKHHDAGAEARLRRSGFYVSIDEFAGLDRLDREELDETDDDASRSAG